MVEASLNKNTNRDTSEYNVTVIIYSFVGVAEVVTCASLIRRRRWFESTHRHNLHRRFLYNLGSMGRRFESGLPRKLFTCELSMKS